jgi:WD40 repeat protein
LTHAPTIAVPNQATQEAEAVMETAWRARNATEMALLPGCDTAIDRSYSPDGNWVAIQCVNPITEIYNLNNPSLVWSLKYNEIFGLEDEYTNQFFYIIPWHWSVDGRYLYLSIHPCCMDGGCPEYYVVAALVRLDLITGEVTQTLRPGEDNMLYGFSFSEGDTYLAYWRTWIEYPVLNIQNLVTGEEQHISLGEQYSEVGDVVWSPDKSQIVFSARNMDYCENMMFYLVMMDLSDLSQRVLWEGPDVGYHPVEWTEDNHIILTALHSSGYVSMDLTTLEIIPYPIPTSTTSP